MKAGMLILAEHVLKLNQRLAQALGPNAADDGSPEFERDRYVLAMIAFGDFVIASGGEPTIANKIVELGSMLSDLSHGTVADVLRPPTFSNRHADVSRVHRARAYAALGIYALIKNGKSRNEAAGEAARKIPNLARLCSDKKMGSKKTAASTAQSAALSWYEELKKGRARHVQAVHIFNTGRANIDLVHEAKIHSALPKSARFYFRLVVQHLSAVS
jgi:hypothetical protein